MSQRIEVPARARRLCTLGEVDYADAFAADHPANATPRGWLTGFFGAHPRLAGAVPKVHRRILGLRLDGPSETYGWQIIQEGETQAVLGAEGRLMTARIVAYSTPEQAVFATFIRYEHPAARVIWAAVSVVHRKLARRIVARAEPATPEPGRARQLPRRAVVLPAGLESADYVDVFELTTTRPDPRSPEDLVRAALEHTPAVVREGIRFIHHSVMGLELAARHQPGHIAGWRVTETTAQAVRLEAASRLGSAAIVFQRTEPSTARVITAITYSRGRTGPAIWRLVGAIHRRAAPRLMEWTAPA